MPSYVTGDIDELPVKFAAISASASADIVAAVTGKRIRVLAYTFSLVGTSPTAKFQSGGSTDLTGTFAPTSGQVLMHDAGGLAPAFQTNLGEKLNLVLAGTSPSAQGHLSFVLVDH